MKRTPLKRKKGLHMRGTSDSSVLKEKIQAMLNKIVVARDGGCILRDYPEAGKCGPIKSTGKPVLQAEHLNGRSNMNSFADSRNIVCLCQRHHIYWKPQNSRRYWEIIEEMIGAHRWELVKAWQDDRKPHKIDLKLSLVALEQEYKKMT